MKNVYVYNNWDYFMVQEMDQCRRNYSSKKPIIYNCGIESGE